MGEDFSILLGLYLREVANEQCKVGLLAFFWCLNLWFSGILFGVLSGEGGHVGGGPLIG
jgi:hypothetical protein